MISKKFEEHPYLRLFSDSKQTIFCSQSNFSEDQQRVVDIIAPIAIDNFDSAKRAKDLLVALNEISCPEYFYVDSLLTNFCEVFKFQKCVNLIVITSYLFYLKILSITNYLFRGNQIPQF